MVVVVVGMLAVVDAATVSIVRLCCSTTFVVLVVAHFLDMLLYTVAVFAAFVVVVVAFLLEVHIHL